MTPEVCPVCGAEVPPQAKACPGCGSDEQTGWSEEAYVSSLGLPEDDFNHDDFCRRELGGKSPLPTRWFWWVVAVAVAAVFLLSWLT